MIYTVTQSKDPDMFEFWNEYADKKKTPMLCFILHTDCMDSHIAFTVREAGEATVFFEFTS